MARTPERTTVTKVRAQALGISNIENLPSSLTDLIPGDIPEFQVVRSSHPEFFEGRITEDLTVLQFPHEVINHVGALYSNEKKSNGMFNYDFIEIKHQKTNGSDTYLACVVERKGKPVISLAKIYESNRDESRALGPVYIYTSEKERSLASDSTAMLIAGFALKGKSVTAKTGLVMDEETNKLDRVRFVQAGGIISAWGFNIFNSNDAYGSGDGTVVYAETRDIVNLSAEVKSILKADPKSGEVSMKLVTEDYVANYSTAFKKSYLKDIVNIDALREGSVTVTLSKTHPTTVEEWLEETKDGPRYEQYLSVNTSSALLQLQTPYPEETKMRELALEHYQEYSKYIDDTLPIELFDSLYHLKVSGRNVLEFVGPAGSGKTFMANITAAIRHQPSVLISADRRTDSATLLGTPVADEESGLYVYKDNDIINLLKYGGVLILDEWSSMEASAIKFLHSITDGSRRFTHPNGKSVEVHEDFLLILTRNGLDYEGSERPGQAMVSRLATFIPVPYPSADVLTKRLMNETGYRNQLHVNKMATFMLEVNELFHKDGEEDRIITPRELSAWLFMSEIKQDFIEAAKLTVLSKLMAYEDSELNQIYISGVSVSAIAETSSTMRKATDKLRRTFMDVPYSLKDNDKFSKELEEINYPDEWDF